MARLVARTGRLGTAVGTRRHGETSVIAELMTRHHGRHQGLVKGGRGGVLGMIGEGRSDELIVPLDRAGNNGLGTTINVTVHSAPGASARDIGRDLQRYLNEYVRAT